MAEYNITSLVVPYKTKPRVIITNASMWSYFDWFLLGFYKLRDAGEIELDFRLPLINKILSAISVRGIGRLRRKFIADDYNMDGYIIFTDGTRKTFTIDCADSPHIFDADKLRNTDIYFKMQCPIDLDSDYFAMSDVIHAPWSDHKYLDNSQTTLTTIVERRVINDFAQYTSKIKPLMIGPRRLSNGILYKSLESGYNNYLSARSMNKAKKFMCYFGNAQGPKPRENITRPDYDSEGSIMGFYGSEASHPNEKRAKIAEYLSQFRGMADARIISTANADSGIKTNKELIVPIEDFCKFISGFQYNFNVSGYRKSIPNRFIESFIVGTAIVTDKLSVKWYLPFDPCEVFETVEMGYLRNDKVDWEQFRHDVKTLPETEPQKIIDCFNRKWEPSVVARYIIDTVKNG